MTSYSIKRTLTNTTVREVVERVIAALANEGFGVLCDIDAQKTLREKLGKETRPYRILGACNPQFAHQALEAEKDIGLLLPCNVVVYEEADGSVVVAAIRPSVAMQVTDSAALATIAQEVEERLERVIQGITAD